MCVCDRGRSDTLGFSIRESHFVPGRHVTDQQMRLFMKLRQTHPIEVAEGQWNRHQPLAGHADGMGAGADAEPEARIRQNNVAARDEQRRRTGLTE